MKKKRCENSASEYDNHLIKLMVYTDKRVTDYYKANEEIISEIDGLTEWKLLEDLQEANKLQHGYFKNDVGEYRYLKGIEVTNDTSNLCRMGFNGEDRGVWVHYCEVDDRRVVYADLPINSFIYWMTDWVEEEKRFYPTTKEDFDQQVQKTIQNIISDYTEKRDAKEYLDFINGWNDLTELVRKEYVENGEMRKAGEQRLFPEKHSK